MPLERIKDPAKLRRVMWAVLFIEADLSLPTLLEHLVEEARDLVGARYGALGVLNEDATALEDFITVGLDAEERRAIGDLPQGRGVLGLLIVDPRSLRLEHLTDHPEHQGFPAHHPAMDSFLGVPVTSKGSVYGNLYLTDKLEPGGFTEEDEAMVSALALAAGIAIENARLHGRVRELALLEDRERIARDLHDTVIQRLFAVGLSLQGTTRLVEGSAAERVSQAVEDIDATIRQIRTSIFDLESIAHHDGVRRQILDLVHELDPVINADIRVTFDGPVDSVVPPVVAEHLLATAREALLNVGKHAGAHRVTVAVSAGPDLCLEVIDDGRGLPPEPDRSTGLGLKNMHSRATMLRGSFEVGSPVGDGTVLTWRVPL